MTPAFLLLMILRFSFFKKQYVSCFPFRIVICSTADPPECNIILVPQCYFPLIQVEKTHEDLGAVVSDYDKKIFKIIFVHEDHPLQIHNQKVTQLSL